MPTLGAPLDFAKLEGRNFRAHQLGTPPSSPVAGQLYYDTAANVLYYYNGSSWVSAAGGAPPDATASVKGVVQLAGDLAGTAAAPAVATGAITSAKIADGTITDTDVAAANKDGAVATPSMRTLGAGAVQAMPGNRTLDAIAPPVAAVNMNAALVRNVAQPISANDAATMIYVDTVAQGLDAKQSVRAAATSNVAALSGTQTIDGIALVVGDRVLLTTQSVTSENGIYVVASGAWTRALDLNQSSEAQNAYVWVEQGTVNADTGWVCTVDSTFSIGINAMTWTQFSGAGQIIAGAGLTKTGNQLDVGTVAGNGILVAADSIGLDSATVPRYFSSVNPSAQTVWTITQAFHQCRAAPGLIVQVRDYVSGLEVLPDIAVANTGDVTVTFAVQIQPNSMRVVIVG